MTFAIPVQTLYHRAVRPDGSLVNSLMHVYVRLANFTPNLAFKGCKPVTISSMYSQRSKVEKNTHSKIT